MGMKYQEACDATRLAADSLGIVPNLECELGNEALDLLDKLEILLAKLEIKAWEEADELAGKY